MTCHWSKTKPYPARARDCIVGNVLVFQVIQPQAPCLVPWTPPKVVLKHRARSQPREPSSMTPKIKPKTQNKNKNSKSQTLLFRFLEDPLLQLPVPLLLASEFHYPIAQPALASFNRKHSFKTNPRAVPSSLLYKKGWAWLYCPIFFPYIFRQS